MALSDRVVVLKAEPGPHRRDRRPARPAAAAARRRRRRSARSSTACTGSSREVRTMAAAPGAAAARARSGWCSACSSTCGRRPAGARTSTSSAARSGYELDDLLPVTEAAKRLGPRDDRVGRHRADRGGPRAGRGGGAGAQAPPARSGCEAAPHRGDPRGARSRKRRPRAQAASSSSSCSEHFSPVEARAPARDRARLGALRRGVRLRPRHRGVRPARPE